MEKIHSLVSAEIDNQNRQKRIRGFFSLVGLQGLENDVFPAKMFSNCSWMFEARI